MRVTRISSAVSSKNHPEITDPQSQRRASHQLRHITRTGLCITLDLLNQAKRLIAVFVQGTSGVR